MDILLTQIVLCWLGWPFLSIEWFPEFFLSLISSSFLFCLGSCDLASREYLRRFEICRFGCSLCRSIYILHCCAYPRCVPAGSSDYRRADCNLLLDIYKRYPWIVLLFVEIYCLPSRLG